jgi:hypothetical protein
MKRTLKIITVISLLIAVQIGCSNKPFYNTQDKVVEEAYKSLDYEMKSGDLKEWADERGMKGNYTFKLTIGGKKGEVISVNTLERSSDGEVMQQNALKNYVKLMRFQFKMPKDKSYQFPYEFKF